MTESALVPVEQKTILFYEDEVTAVRLRDGAVYVPIKPIIERLGLNWSGQRSRLQRDPILKMEQRMCVIHTHRRGPQETLCIPLDYLSGFLFGINADRVKSEYREGELYRKFGITSYRMLPARRFDEAMKFLTDWHENVTGAGAPF